MQREPYKINLKINLDLTDAMEQLTEILDKLKEIQNRKEDNNEDL